MTNAMAAAPAAVRCGLSRGRSSRWCSRLTSSCPREAPLDPRHEQQPGEDDARDDRPGVHDVVDHVPEGARLPRREQPQRSLEEADVPVRLRVGRRRTDVVGPEQPHRVDLEERAHRGDDAGDQEHQADRLHGERRPDALTDDVALRRAGPVNWVCFWRQTSIRWTAEQADDGGRDQQDVHRIEAPDDVRARPVAAEDQVDEAFTDEGDRQDDGVGDAQAGARQQVVRQRVAGEPGRQREHQHQHADDPVDLPWSAERPGEEDARHVEGDRADEHQRCPVVHLADHEPALDVEGDAQHGLVGARHLDALKWRVRAVVDGSSAGCPRRRTSGTSR